MANQRSTIPPAACPSCGEVQDCAANLIGADAPEPGDLSMCLVCGYISLFDDAMGRRDLTPEEFAAIPDDVLLEVTRIERERVAARARMPWRPRP